MHLLLLHRNSLRTHANLANLKTSQIRTEMTKVEQAFVDIFGKKPAHMRPPNLATSTSMLSVMQQMG
ncbi:polysaccharide deacetylase [Seiridium cupressi]